MTKVHDENGKIKKSYRAWAAMHQRCRNPKAHNYARYGGRGIKVCARWTGPAGYSNFVADLGEPAPGLTLDRFPNNDGDYKPGNCRWATWQQQADNREHKGAPLNPNSIRGLARAAGLPYMVVYLRIKVLGWSKEKALSTPKEFRGPRGESELEKAERQMKVIAASVAAQQAAA